VDIRVTEDDVLLCPFNAEGGVYTKIISFESKAIHWVPQLLNDDVLYFVKFPIGCLHMPYPSFQLFLLSCNKVPAPPFFQSIASSYAAL